MKKGLSLIALAIAQFGCGASDSSSLKASADPSPLEGAWRVVEVTTPGPDSARINRRTPQPGYLMITGRHYAYMHVTSAGPRPPMPHRDSATVESLRAVWGPFNANAGTVEITPNRITWTLVVNKSPIRAGQDVSGSSEYRLTGDSLWITNLQPDTATVPNPNPVTIKYVRER